MSTPPEPRPAADNKTTPPDPPNFGLNLLAAWMFLAAFGQLAHVAGWPVSIAGRPVGDLGGTVVALTRMSVYFALAAGLLVRSREAWAGTVLEMARTFIYFLLSVGEGGHGRLLDLYPAAWAQGVLSGAIPILWVTHLFLSNGWRPRAAVDVVTNAVHIGAASMAVGAVWLRRQYPWFHVSRPAWLRVLILDGVPIVFILSMVELMALWLPLRMR